MGQENDSSGPHRQVCGSEKGQGTVVKGPCREGVTRCREEGGRLCVDGRFLLFSAVSPQQGSVNAARRGSRAPSTVSVPPSVCAVLPEGLGALNPRPSAPGPLMLTHPVPWRVVATWHRLCALQTCGAQVGPGHPAAQGPGDEFWSVPGDHHCSLTKLKPSMWVPGAPPQPLASQGLVDAKQKC